MVEDIGFGWIRWSAILNTGHEGANQIFVIPVQLGSRSITQLSNLIPIAQVGKTFKKWSQLGRGVCFLNQVTCLDGNLADRVPVPALPCQVGLFKIFAPTPCLNRDENTRDQF